MNERIIQIVCADADLLPQYRLELERRRQPYRFRLAQTPDGTRRGMHQEEPGVILLDESAAPDGNHRSTLKSIVARLTVLAPVVVVAGAKRQPELSLLMASGGVDFVARGDGFIVLAANAVEQRARLVDYSTATFASVDSGGNFGEILRHEVNNPLTGILGNAELLLARRDRLPPAAVERVETIAELAMRLRETVRRLSHAWDDRQDPVRSG